MYIRSKLVVAMTFGFLAISAVGSKAVNAASSAPTTSSITPSLGSADTSITIYGTNLSTASAVQFYSSNGQWAGSITNTLDFPAILNGSVTFKIPTTLAVGMAPGPYQVEVVTSDGMSNPQIFTLVAPTSPSSSAYPPTVSYVSPSMAAIGTEVYVYGANFDGATFIGFDGANGTAIQNQSIHLISPSELNFIVPSSLSVGVHSLAVAEKAGPWSLSDTVTFNVITNPQAPIVPVTSKAATTVTNDVNNSSTQALQKQLAQLISLLLQLLQQASAQGLLSASQLNSTLNSIKQ